MFGGQEFDYFVIVVFCGPWIKLLSNFQFHTRSQPSLKESDCDNRITSL